MSGTNPEPGALPSRRALRQNRRAESEAGAPAGGAESAILELPSASVSPADIGPVTGQLPTALYASASAPGRRVGGYALKSTGATSDAGPRPSADGPTSAVGPADATDSPVPAGPADLTDLPARRARRAAGPATAGSAGSPGAAASADSPGRAEPGLPEPAPRVGRRASGPVDGGGQPLTRRELRERRRREEQGRATDGPEVYAEVYETSSQAAVSAAEEGSPRDDATGAERPAGPGQPPTGRRYSHQSLAEEVADLSRRMEESRGNGPGGPGEVDPELLREQRALARRARALNTSALQTVTAADGGPDPEPAPEPVPEAPPEPGQSRPARPGSGSRRAQAPATGSGAGTAPAARVGPVHEPLGASSAHGLDSIKASNWSSRERTLLLVLLGAALAVIVLIVVLIIVLNH